jgi:hypothetical protein
MGGMVYRKHNHPYGFFFQGKQFPCDTNSNLECFRRILDDIAKSRGGKLPKVLYVQMDNTGKENKNWIFFTYLAYLVLVGYGTIEL